MSKPVKRPAVAKKASALKRDTARDPARGAAARSTPVRTPARTTGRTTAHTTARSSSRPTALSVLPNELTTAATRSNLAEQAYEKLKAEIHDFQLVPGDRFSEVEIGTRLGVSRTPVREALFRLRNEGFLEVESKSGWYVKPIDFAKLEQLYDLRVLLEHASIAKLCTQPDDAPELAELKAIWLVPVAERLTDGLAVGALDEAFHATLVRAAGNAEISRVHWDVTERIRIIRRLDFTRGDRIEATYHEHGKILRAVIQRKLDQAQLLLKSHIEQSKAEVRKITLHMLHEAREQLASNSVR